MGETMTPAAQVRRDFRLGRPPKAGDALPMHRTVVWQKAMDALAAFRARMTAAKLNPNHATAAIVFIELADPDRPHMLLLEEEIGKPSENCRQKAFEQLGRDDVIALGMVFRQFDAEKGKEGEFTRFPYQFTGLNERGIAVLRKAVELWHEAGKLTKAVN